MNHKDIIKIVAKSYKISPRKLRSKTRERLVAESKKVAIFFIRTKLKYTLSRCVQAIGQKYHAMAFNACVEVQKRRDANPNLDLQIRGIERDIEQFMILQNQIFGNPEPTTNDNETH